MSSGALEVTPEVENLVKANREKREKLKLEILASLKVPAKGEDPSTAVRARRMTSEMVLLGMTNVGINLEVDVSGLTSNEALRLRFVHHLAKLKEDNGVREKQKLEIERMKEVHEKSRKELKTQEETTKAVRVRVRRLRRVLQVLQTRLVASTLALQFQMTRKIELTQRLENINYYRDTIMENALAFLFGQVPDSNPIPLGGVFSTYAYIDYDDEEERLEREQVYLTSLTPAAFKSSAQSRRAAFRTLISDAVLPTVRFGVQTNSPSVEYSSLAHLSSFSQSSISNSGDIPSPRRLATDDSAGALVGASVLEASPAGKRSTLRGGLKPSMSDKPTKHEIASSGKRPAPGIFSIFKKS